MLALRAKGGLGQKGVVVARGVVPLNQLVQDHYATTPWSSMTVGLELNGLPVGGWRLATAADACAWRHHWAPSEAGAPCPPCEGAAGPERARLRRPLRAGSLRLVARVVEVEVAQPALRQLLHDAMRQTMAPQPASQADAGEGRPSDLRNVKSQPLDSGNSQQLESVASVPRNKMAKSTSK